MALRSRARLKAARGNLDALSDGSYLDQLIGELQGLTVSTAAGVAANTNIAVSGIATEDTLIAVLVFKNPAATTTAAIVNETATSSITSAGNIQSTNATNADANDRLVIIWFNKNP